MTEPKADKATSAARAVTGRLLQVRQLWQDAADSYFDPPRFRLSLQQCITFSRTVSFLVQAEKDSIKNFEEWYEAYRERWRSDSIMRWSVDARNTIEKQRDLETHSQVRATIVASYIGGATTDWMPQALFASPQQIFAGVPKRFRIPHVVENGTLVIERRWIDSGLPEIEVLEALAHVYRELTEMVVGFLDTLNVALP